MSILPLPEKLLHHHHLQDLCPLIDGYVNQDFRQRSRIKSFLVVTFHDMSEYLHYLHYIDVDSIINDMADIFIKATGLYFSQMMETHWKSIAHRFKLNKSRYKRYTTGAKPYYILLDKLFNSFMPVSEFSKIKVNDSDDVKREKRFLLSMKSAFDDGALNESKDTQEEGTYDFWFLDLISCMGIDEGFYGDMNERFDDLNSYMDVEVPEKFYEYIKTMLISEYEKDNGIRS